MYRSDAMYHAYFLTKSNTYSLHTCDFGPSELIAWINAYVKKYMCSILLAERPSDKRTVWAEKDVMLLQDHTFHAKEVRNGKSEVRKVTYKNGVLSKIDLASRFPKGPQKNAKFGKTAEKTSYIRIFSFF